MNDNIKILDKMGVKHQAYIWVEELAELQQAITKWMRKYDELNGDITEELKKHIIEEYVDTVICLEQIDKSIGGITKEEFYDMYNFKISRQKERVGLE